MKRFLVFLLIPLITFGQGVAPRVDSTGLLTSPSPIAFRAANDLTPSIEARIIHVSRSTTDRKSVV